MTLNLLNPKNPILEQLEWNIIIKEVIGNAHFTQYAENSIFNSTLTTQEIEFTYNQTSILEEIYFNDQFNASLNAIQFLKSEQLTVDTLKRLSKNAALEINELNAMATLLFFGHEHNEILAKIAPLSEDCAKFLTQLHKVFLKDFRKLVLEDGTINYQGHPQLRMLDEKKTKLEISIRNFLNNLQSSALYDRMQYSGHDIINDHYVVPIRSDSYSSSIGEIISRSETGNTLYVEPFEIRDLSYKRLNTIIEIQNIIYKLTKQFSEILFNFFSQIQEISQQIFKFDCAAARIQYAMKFGLKCPKISNVPKIYMDGFFHPLINDPVKNYVRIDHENKGLVISGPNTGGKTVSLKSILIALLSLKHGLYVAANDSELYPYQGLFYFGNDQQSLSQGLSSFAAEVKNYNELLDHLEETNAIFIDEVFNSTSSEEASALAISYFNAIQEQAKSHILVSTHHQMLKSFIHQKDEYISSHVGFDTSANRPTYKLIYGVPGSSMALEIFKILSSNDKVHQEIYSNSLKLLDNKVVNYNQLLEKISTKQGELDKLLIENKNLNNELKNQKNAMDGILKLKADNFINDLEFKIKNIQDEAEALVKNIKKGELTSSKQVYQSFRDIKQKTSDLIPKRYNQPKNEDIIPNLNPEELIEGQTYFCRKIKSTVTLKSFNQIKDEAIVAKGAFTLKCKISELSKGNNLEEIKRKFVFKYDKTSDAKIEYDCRGMRLEQFQDIVNSTLSDVLCGDVPFISYIHGHGDGVLKNWLRKYISRHKDLQWLQGENGNDGETKILLKQN